MSRPRRWLLAFFLFLLGGALVVTVICYRGHRRLSRELESIRDTGEPVLIEEVPLPSLQGLDTVEWLARVETLEAGETFGPDAYFEEFLRDDLVVTSIEEYRQALEFVGTCLDSLDWAVLWTEAHAKLDLEREGDHEMTQCEQTLIHAIAASYTEWREVISEPERLALPHDSKLPVHAVVGAVDALVSGAMDDALSGSPEAAIEGIADALRAAEWTKETADPLGNDLRMFALRICLSGLRRVLPRLPLEVEVVEIQSALEAIDARAEFRRSLIVWRAFTNSLFDSYRSEVGWGHAGLFEKIRLPFDQSLFLEYSRQGLEWTDRPYWEIRREIVQWTEEAQESHPLWAPVSAMSMLDYEKSFRLAAYLEADLLLTRGVLVAHRRGTEEALLWAEEQIDPFSGEPFGSRVRTDGVLELWSAGPNGIDQGGRSVEHPYRDDADDITARWLGLN